MLAMAWLNRALFQPMPDAVVTHLYVYPVKSCGGVSVTTAHISPLGMVGDRQWVVVDSATGRFITQREYPVLVRVRPDVHPDGGLTLSYSAFVAGEHAPSAPTLTVHVPAPHLNSNPSMSRVSVWGDEVQARAVNGACDEFFTAVVGIPCRLFQLHEARPIDGGAHPGAIAFSDGYPLLIVNDASVESLNSHVATPLSHLNFRPNIVVRARGGAFAEDRWARVSLGGMAFLCPKPCGRCGMPSINPVTGERVGDAQPLVFLRKARALGDNGCFGINALLSAADSAAYTAEGTVAVGLPVKVLEFQSSPFRDL